MNNPYRPPSAVISEQKQKAARIAHSLAALISGTCIVPIVLFGVARILFPDETLTFGNARFWASLLIGSTLCSIAIYPFKRMPLALAAVIGFVVAVVAI